MKGKAAISKGPVGERLAMSFGNEAFARGFLEILEKCLGAKNTANCPAEYYVQEPNMTVSINGKTGVEFRLSGASRGGRTPQMFQAALKDLHHLCHMTIQKSLKENDFQTAQAQLFVAIMIDGDVSDGKGGFSPILESKAEWVGFPKV